MVVVKLAHVDVLPVAQVTMQVLMYDMVTLLRQDGEVVVVLVRVRTQGEGLLVLPAHIPVEVLCNILYSAISREMISPGNVFC